MDFGLNLTQEQKLIMTQQMQLSVKILQMSAYELEQYVYKEIQENPVLDIKYTQEEGEQKEKIDYKKLIKYFDEDNRNYKEYGGINKEEKVSPFNYISSKKSLKEYLNEQILESEENDEIKNVGRYIIENLDRKGYLDNTVENISEELNISMAIVERALEFIQSLEPCGIAARDLKECLKIQLIKKRISDVIAYEIVDRYLELLADNKYSILAKKLNINIKKAQDYGDLIKLLEPKPARGFFTGEETKYVIPDAYIRKINKEYIILMNDNLIPNLKVNKLYKDIINNKNDNNDTQTVKYVKEKLNSAVFLIKSIEQRKGTLYKVLEEIISIQREYFDYGKMYLKPMTLKEIADQIQVHESTVSRAIRDKYISTNKGTIKIKDLFTTGIISEYGNETISANSIKKEIEDLINDEDKHKPLSDQKICNILNEEGMNISRRTVAKYREEMGIKSSSKRKRY